MTNEQNNKLMKQSQHSLTLQRKDLTVRAEQKEISLYSFGEVSAKCLAENNKLLNMSFPRLKGDWYKLVEKMIDELGFNDRKYTDAVKNLILTYKFPEPAPAVLFQFDKTIKIYSYEDLLEKASLTYDPFQHYKAVNIDGERFFVFNRDLIENNINLPDWVYNKNRVK